MEKQNRPALTLQERIDAIRNSESIDQLTSDILPKSHQEDYYFVSYSHLDYREVLVDILQMEEQGLHFWYDTDIHIGENWEHIAKSYISKFQCKGVIFYLSKNSINSPACNKEIKYVVDHGINYFSINLPLDEETPICSGKNMVDILKNTEGFTFNEKINLAETEELFEEHFNDKVIYLPYTASTTNKVDEIKKTLKGKDLFEFRALDNSGFGYDIVLTACRDNSLVSVTIPSEVTLEQIANKDDFDSDDLREFDLLVTKIGEAAFANFFSLEEVILPECLEEIEDLAFVNCTSLKKINLHSCNWLKYIGPKTFKNCKKLTKVIFPDGVIAINPSAFSDCKSLSSVAFGENSRLTTIGEDAFIGCNSLTSITIPDNVTTIDIFAFYECDCLTSVTFGENSQLTTIGTSAFRDCTSLTSLVIPDSVTSIGEYAFGGCHSLTSIVVDEANATYKSIDDNLYSKDGKTLVQYAFGKTDTTFTIPDNMTTIGKDAFSGCKSLTSITIPNSVSTIDKHAFSCCDSLTNVTFSENSQLTTIGEDAFSFCDSLTSITIPNSVSTIDKHAFIGCHNLTRVTFGENSQLTTIGEEAFSGCDSLTSVTFGENSQLTTIGENAFYSCDSLTSITIPNSVTTIENGAFTFCQSLTNVTFGENSQLTTIGEYAFSLCDSLTSINIPDSVTTIVKGHSLVANTWAETTEEEEYIDNDDMASRWWDDLPF